MKITLAEPVSPRYIYINPETNKVHLMLPVVSGTSIGLDNTCKAVHSLQEFLGKSLDPKQVTALNELTQYKTALEFDLKYIAEDNPLKQEKRDRLEQINHYINALTSLAGNKVLDTLNGDYPAYPEPLQALMRDIASNLYSILLRPAEQDVNLRTSNPVFSLNRKNDDKGNPDSAFYNALVDAFKNLLITPQGAHARLVNAVLATAEASNNDFAGIQRVLNQTAKALFNAEVNFNQSNAGETITEDFITDVMAFNNHSLYIRSERPNPIGELYYNHYLFINGQELLYIRRNGDVETVNIHDMNQLKNELVKINPEQSDEIDLLDEQIKTLITSNGGHVPPAPTAAEYVDALLGYCAPNLFDTLLESPFYAANTAKELSILTQLFMAHINIYCASHGLSTANFGKILDGSEALSEEITARILSAQAYGLSIEDALLDCVNENQATFQLTQPLTPEDMNTIKTQFTEHYAEIKESPHFDEFVVLETHKPGLFVTHQGSICTDFAEFAKSSLLSIDSSYFQDIREDYKRIAGAGVISHKNEHVEASSEVNLLALDETELEALLKTLPLKSRLQILKTMPELQIRLQLRDFLNHVARGEQSEAEGLLKNNPEIAQKLLSTPGTFTDYSKREFTCTAYEYAYWAKDKHMCRMLEKQMDDKTKVGMLKQINNMEQVGLAYQVRPQDPTQAIKHYKNAHYDTSFLLKQLAASEFLQLQTILNGKFNKISEATPENYQSISFSATEYEHIKKELASLPNSQTLCDKLVFDFNSVITALQKYVDGYDNWEKTRNWAAMDAAWLQVGRAQADTVMHLINEYCRKDRSFNPCPEFNEDNLPRELMFYNFDLGREERLFPLVISPTSGLGINFSLLHTGRAAGGERWWRGGGRGGRRSRWGRFDGGQPPR